jgi:cytosine/adenosine deaminase-related metal-dependent hydrolase
MGSLTENEGCMAKYNKTPTGVMNDAGVFDGPCIAAHCVHLNDNDREILAEKNVSIALCPTSKNVNFGSTAIDANRAGWVSGAITAVRGPVTDTFTFGCSMDLANAAVRNVELNRR